ncbi:MAG: ABC transporter C-terminal domain-containing protein, partial [Candidatus Tenebribacter davisii]|nr:ABC transporter C-terminal domain-containing protein [Candidatus Tenebribacter davisii]
MEEIENKIEQLELDKKKLQEQILKNAATMKPADFKENSQKHETIDQELCELEERWLDLSAIED